MTPLEALKKLENYVHYEMGIRTFQQSGWHIEGSDEYAIIEKSLKALEIIKNKDVDIGFMKYLIKMNYNVDHYNIAFDEGDAESYLTQDEFDLLKEVLK